MSATVFDFDASFEFTRRPRSVPGDLRIAWRISVLLLGLYKSRGKRASYYKIHVLNDLFVNPSACGKLRNILNGDLPAIVWRTRVDPSLNRATDFLVGEGLSNWTEASERANLVLTAKGIQRAESLFELADVLSAEKEISSEFSMKLTESFVRSLYFNRFETDED